MEILENDLYSKFFDLERGNAQGDTTSPYIFNIGYQILIFKINYDLQIAGIIETPTVPPDLQPPNLNKQVNSRHCPLKSTQPWDIFFPFPASTEQTQSRSKVYDSIFVNNFGGETGHMFEVFIILLDIAY